MPFRAAVTAITEGASLELNNPDFCERPPTVTCKPRSSAADAALDACLRPVRPRPRESQSSDINDIVAFIRQWSRIRGRSSEPKPFPASLATRIKPCPANRPVELTAASS
jgi:hypothetical protein